MKWILTLLILAIGMRFSEQPATVGGTVVCTPKHPSENIVVFVTGTLTKPPQPPKQPAVIDQRHLRFTPKVLPVSSGTVVAFPNNDPVFHNVYSPSETRMFNLGTYAPGVTRTMKFDRRGVVKILCNVHPEMLAYVVVIDTPHYTKTDKSGLFRIRNIPPGKYRLNFWCEHTGFHVQDIMLAAGQTSTVSSVLDPQTQGNGVPADPTTLSTQIDCHSSVTF